MLFANLFHYFAIPKGLTGKSLIGVVINTNAASIPPVNYLKIILLKWVVTFWVIK